MLEHAPGACWLPEAWLLLMRHQRSRESRAYKNSNWKTCKSNNWMNHIHDFPIERRRSCMLGLQDLKGCWTVELVANLEALSLCKEAHVAKQHGWSALRSLWARCIHSVTLWIHLESIWNPFGYPSDSVLDLSHSRWCLRDPESLFHF